MQWVILLLSQNIKTQILEEVLRGWKDGKTKIITNSLEIPASWQQDFVRTRPLFLSGKLVGQRGTEGRGNSPFFL